jgi:hypothetical protein
MAVIKTSFGSGGSGLAPNSSGDPSLATILRAFVSDVTEIRTKFGSLLTKLDADAGVSDANYAATLALATQQNTNG